MGNFFKYYYIRHTISHVIYVFFFFQFSTYHK